MKLFNGIRGWGMGILGRWAQIYVFSYVRDPYEDQVGRLIAHGMGGGGHRWGENRSIDFYTVVVDKAVLSPCCQQHTLRLVASFFSFSHVSNGILANIAQVTQSFGICTKSEPFLITSSGY